ncbi:hypothetical protein LL06_26405 [Hoeflea sp. BAL378]|nr:hypothetical protein LL06_26405 [Hoeflea sp. BAL378]
MNHPPFFAEFCNCLCQLSQDPRQLRPVETIAFPQHRRTGGTMQQKHRLAIRASDMDMLGPMIIGIDHHPQAIEAQNRRHPATIP